MVCGSTAPLAADWWDVALDLTLKSIMARNGRWKKCNCMTITIEKAVGVRSSKRRLAFVCWRSPRLYNLLREKKVFFFQPLHLFIYLNSTLCTHVVIKIYIERRTKLLGSTFYGEK